MLEKKKKDLQNKTKKKGEKPAKRITYINTKTFLFYTSGDDKEQIDIYLRINVLIWPRQSILLYYWKMNSRTL